MFQFARPCRARPGGHLYLLEYDGFNSRARVGRDVASSKDEDRGGSFNSRARVGRD